ncbi:hypothetical protein MPSEU_000720000 [Mayamaea pseudoterrestris]|nr:hypothetical protein MPSEU_000720000 [Mayamaea pseudoterrestris]
MALFTRLSRHESRYQHIRSVPRTNVSNNDRNLLLTTFQVVRTGPSITYSSPLCTATTATVAQLKRFSSGTLSTKDEIKYETADDIYQRYSQKVDELKHYHQEQERVKNEKMYKAWQRADERTKEENANSTKRRNTGVAVVKTLVKETHKDRAKLQEIEDSLKQEAQSLLEQAADQGHAQALVQLGNQALERAHEAWKRLSMEETRLALDQAIAHYRNSRSPEGWFNLGNLLWLGYPDSFDEGSDGVTRILPADRAQSMLAFREAIRLGDADAMYFVGVAEMDVAVDDGNNTYTGLDESTHSVLANSVELIQQAANKGHGGALYYLALLHLNGHAILNIPPCSPSEFVSRLNAAADSGQADALFLRGHCFYNGDHGYSHDMRRALDDFLLAADEGNADAAVSAGAILFNGHFPDVPRNQEQAFAMYQHAGELGSMEGWRNVVACYATGEGVVKNEQIAKYITETMLKDQDE